MDEFSFIKAIKPKHYMQSSVINGIGDDGAVVQPSIGSQMVIATDTMVENVHFSFDYMSYEDVGYRVLAANLSDLAAMGSTPLYYIVNISGPNEITNDELVRIMNGTKELAKLYNMDLIGGDTTSSQELVITVTVFGELVAGYKRLRRHAQPNDVVFVTGYLGESGYGFQLIKKGKYEDDSRFIKQHIRPKPRLDFAQVIKTIKRVSLNDVSDGISSELNEIAEASNVSIVTDWNSIPIHPEMKHLKDEELEKLTLSTGEDFQLVGTCSEEAWNNIKSICSEQEIKVTKIGEVLPFNKQESSVYIIKNGKRKKLDSEGYQHGKYKGD
ncbi:thiamine-phosphate kinase [Piscibacillus sp. B03]|uniref:thiamine-phosphate kinase n=1 Tax=Piscibacillus sp. B03 TaxID=3457430 RepID=UPI003FCED135